MSQKFDCGILTVDDRALMDDIIGIDRLGVYKDPNLVIAPDGKPYLYRWHIVHRQDRSNVYFHIQVASDPERPLHDHPWDNCSVILSGGYDEIWDAQPWLKDHANFPLYAIRRLHAGDVCRRSAADAHRLILPPEYPYTMTLFTTGPRVRDWGFWFPDGWRSFSEVTETKDGLSVFTQEAENELTRTE